MQGLKKPTRTSAEIRIEQPPNKSQPVTDTSTYSARSHHNHVSIYSFVYLYIYGLSNDGLSSLDHTASSCRMNNE
jgi:hypothetical protein